MKIGFIGLGNMATAMIGGMLQKGIAKPEDIIGSSKTETTAEKVKTKFNINTTTDNVAVAEEADIHSLLVYNNARYSCSFSGTDHSSQVPGVLQILQDQK